MHAFPTPPLTSTGHTVTSHPVGESQTKEGGNEVKKKREDLE